LKWRWDTGAFIMQTKLLRISFLAVLLVSLTGCVTPPPPPEGKLYIRTLIDGKDTLYIRGNEIWFVHQAYQLPGKWAGEDLPTYINQDQQWDIEWNGTLSKVETIAKPESALPTTGTWTSDNMMVKFFTAGYGVPMVKEYPSAENKHTLIIELDDVEPLGAHWFCIDVDWDETANQ